MKKLFLNLTLLLLLCFTAESFAIDNFSTSGFQYDDETRSVEIIISDNRSEGQHPNSASITIAGTQLENVTYTSYDHTEEPITFVFVVDNTSNYIASEKGRPAKIAEEIFTARNKKNDDYYLISFDTTVHEPIGPYNNTTSLFNSLTYNVSGDSDYSEALDKAISLLDSDTKFAKKAIILITDGYQTKNPAKSLDVLVNDLLKAGYPVFTCGLMRSQEQRYIADDLKNLQTISENTGGVYFSFQNPGTQKAGQVFLDQIMKSAVVRGTLPDDFSLENPSEEKTAINLSFNGREISTINTELLLPAILPIAEAIAEPEDTTEPTTAVQTEEPAITEEISLTRTPNNSEEVPPEESSVGPEEVPSSETQTPEVTEEAVPTETPEATEEAVPTETPEATEESVPTETPVESENSENTENESGFTAWMKAHLGENWVLVLAAGCLLLVLIIVILIRLFGKKKDDKDNQKTFVNDDYNEDEKTESTPSVKVSFTDTANRNCYNVNLVNGASKVFGRSNDPVKEIIGLGNEGHISQKHFQVTYKDEMVLIEDLGSTNGTYLNGKKLIPGQGSVLTNGSTIKIGQALDGRKFGYEFTATIQDL